MRGIDSNNQEQLHKLQEKLGHKFRTISLLEQSLVHKSYSNENSKFKNINNEKLELLGDSVLSVISTEYLYFMFNYLSEGEIVKIKSAVVSEPTLADMASSIDLGEYMFLSKGEETSGGRQRPSILADCFEAVLGAIFIDGGLEKAKEFLLPLLGPKVLAINADESAFDYKTILQEHSQKELKEIPEYVLQGNRGPDHDKIFRVAVFLKDQYVAEAEGHSKKEAEQKAARSACYMLDVPIYTLF